MLDAHNPVAMADATTKPVDNCEELTERMKEGSKELLQLVHCHHICIISC